MRGNNKKWGKARIIREIRHLVDNNVDISFSNIRRNYHQLFRAAMHERYFRGWHNAVEAAGYIDLYNRHKHKNRSRRRKRKYYWNREKILKELKILHAKEATLSWVNIINNHSSLYAAAISKRYFGSWRNALEQIGVNYKALRRKMRQKRKIKHPPFQDKFLNKAVRAWQKELRFRNISEEIEKKYLSSIRSFDRFMNPFYLKQTTQQDIRNYLLFKKKKGLVARSLKADFQGIKSLCTFCFDNKILDFNPAAGIVLPKPGYCVTRALTEAELKKFLKHIYGCKKGRPFIRLRNKVLVQLMVFTGLRRGELVRLKVCDIDLKKKLLFVERGKMRKDRIIPLNEALIFSLKDYLIARKKRNGTKNLLITNSTGNALSPVRISEIIRCHSVDSGLGTKVSPQVLRHTMASLLVGAGLALETIGKLLGHASITTTYQYVHASPEFLRQEIRKHPLIGLI